MNTMAWIVRTATWATLGLVVLTCSCAPPVRCWQEHELKARVVEVYDADAQSTFDTARLPPWLTSGSFATCGDLDGLGAGSELVLTEVLPARNSHPSSCMPFSARVASRTDVEPLEVASTGLVPTYDLYADGVLTLADGCTGEWTFAYLPGDRQVGTPWTVGALPPAIWVRYFHTLAAENCPTLPAGSSGSLSCADVWAGEITEP